jgi:hypothetical protein
MPLARLFDGDNTEYLKIEQAVLGANPMSFALWFWTTTSGLDADALFFMGDKDVGDKLQTLDVYDTKVRIGASNLYFTPTTTTYAVRNWNHAVGVWAGDQDRRVYLNGGGKATDTVNSYTPSNFDRTVLGYYADSTPVAPFYGRLSHAALWNVALSDAQVLWLAKGRHGDGRHVLPPDVRPDALVAYWPLDGSDKDFGKFRAYDMAAVNTPGWTGAPPRLIDTSRRGVWKPPVAAGFVSRKSYILGGGIAG